MTPDTADSGRVPPALEAIARGDLVVLVDTDSPDNLGMVVLGAQFATPPQLHALGRLATGWSYLALTDERCAELGLELVAARDDSLQHAPLTVTIQARDAIGAGVGVDQRAHTIAVAIDPAIGREGIRFGGHILPLRGRPGGVLKRAGHTEAALDLAALAGLTPAAVAGELANDDGSAMQGEQVTAFAARHGLPMLTIGDLIAHRRQTERLVDRVAEASIATATGMYRAYGYLAALDHAEHMAMVRGDVAGQDDVLVYIHLSCWEGDVFTSRACDCRARLDAATAAITAADRGVIVHLAHRGYHHHQERASDEQVRDFGIGAQILVDLGLRTIHVLTDHPRPLPGLEGYGLTVSGHAPLLRPA